MTRLVFAVFFLSVALTGGAAPVKVIFDTDMLTDFDDVGALSCLHALADAGECEILATVSCTRGNASVAAIEIINGYYGRGDIPVGCTKGAGVVGDVGSRDGHKATAEEIAATMKRGKEKGDGGHYKYRKLAADYPHWVRHADSDDAPDAVEVYRRVLAAQPDKSVVICSVGFLTNLRLLLQSKGDAHSPLDGRELVARKVKMWVAMCCKYMRGKEYNSMMDPESSRVALSEWPTKVVISDFEFGVDTYAGRAIAEMPGPRNPVKDVFAGSIPTRERVGADPVKWQFMWFGMGGRAAWDETAVLAAVRGETSYFNVRRGEYRMVGEDGEDVWVPDEENGRHLRLTEKVGKLELGRIIDELICRGPKLPVPVALTFDDGCRGQRSVAEPMLAAHGWKGTFNIVTGWKRGVMSWDEIRELKRHGHEITSHSVTHPRMVTLLEEGKTNEVVRELRESAATIERETGAKPRWFCAPYVQQNAELDRLARQEGMRVMTVPRIPFGGKHPLDKDYGKYIDAQLAKKPKALDFLIHGITVATGGWGPFFDEKDFSDFLDAIAERERRGLIRVVPYAEAYEANEILQRGQTPPRSCKSGI